jgi:hypothetical protein
MGASYDAGTPERRDVGAVEAETPGEPGCSMMATFDREGLRGMAYRLPPTSLEVRPRVERLAVGCRESLPNQTG